MQRWRVVVETESGGTRNRYVYAKTLDEAATKVRKKIPVTWRIVSVVEVSE